MKYKKFIYLKTALFIALITINTSCERDLSEDAVFATNSNTGEIFTDSPIGLGTDFYFPFLGSKLTAWTVDDNEGYESQSSMRFDVPNANDPEGNYAGAIFRVDGNGRDLTGYDALTFWAKASQGVVIGEIGFGQDFFDNKYQANVANVSFSTNWVKYIIPIPDPSKLIDERGLFWYSAGTQNTGGLGYVFWIDDLKFEKLGTLGSPRPSVFNGEESSYQTFIGTDGILDSSSTVTFNLVNGLNQTVIAAPSYFNWMSSETSSVYIDETGFYNAIATGEAVITATLAGVEAQGSLTTTVLGEFDFAPYPTQDAGNVISIFSDAYSNVPVDFYNGYWEPFQTTLSADFAINGDNILNYTNFNFVGNQFANPTIDASDMSYLHVDMFIPEFPSFFDFLITVVDFGADGVDGGGDDTRQQMFVTASDVEAGVWNSFELPLTLTNRSNIGLIIYENINFATLRNFYLDNIYFYKE